ncbi:hypothetical protein [Sinorhizobium meliloti]|uniref:hypothetical protein n=1 Tax=Rhizobium meliloti TaxID=382 RepID=UPI000FD91D79|nr:hypothetical protein [Sinorhizobium meliloti]RVM86362.1 hypothetical protein CN122_23395 [Sinorhizobium meliloti]
MSRREQFRGICHGVLGTFVSRYNDLDGYWALGQYVAFLDRIGECQLLLKLGDATVLPEGPGFAAAAKYYRGAVLRMMKTNAMPQAWFANGTMKVSIVATSTATCEIEIVSDLGRTYRSERTINVRPHDPVIERRRTDRFGPSNQKGR